MDSILLCDKCQDDFLPKDSRSLFPILHNLNDLLRSNQLSSCTDAEKAQSYIEAEGRELARCEQEITRLQNALAKLETHRTAVVERIKRFRSWHSPIRRLPVELLEKILALVCAPESGRYALDFRRRGSIYAPVLALTHISHWLRAVASASPSLWSSIRIELSYYKATEDQMIRLESLLALYLSNSKNHPLHLINLCYYYPHNASVTEVLTPHIPRVARLDLVGPETLYERQLPGWLGNAPHAVPMLSDIKISCSHLDLNKLPCHQLKVLEVVDIFNGSPIAPVLKLCTNLQSLILHLPDTAPPLVLDTQTPIEMASLQQLSITVDRALGLSLLRHLVLPSLSSFRLTSLKDAPSLAPIIELIYRSDCHLNAFAMEIHHNSSIPNAELNDFLRACPSLSRLEANLPYSGGVTTKRGAFMCKLLDALVASLSVSSSKSDMQGLGTPVPSPGVVYLSIYEHEHFLDAEVVDDILHQLESRTEALNAYRAKIPILRWKWDIGFETLWEREPGVMDEFGTRIENLAKNASLTCNIRAHRKGPIYSSR